MLIDHPAGGATMTNPMRALRWYSTLALIFFGLGPAVMLTLLVLRGNTPGSVAFPLAGGIVLILAAAVQTLRGIVGTDPEQISRYLHLSLTLTAGAALLMLGGNALIRMTGA